MVREKSGAASPAYAGELGFLGKNLLSQKKYGEAEVILSECRAIRDKVEPGAWTTFQTLSMLGAAWAGQQKYDAAAPLLVQGYEGMKRVQDKIPNEIRTKRLTEALNYLVKLYDDWGKPDEAAKPSLA